MFLSSKKIQMYYVCSTYKTPFTKGFALGLKISSLVSFFTPYECMKQPLFSKVNCQGPSMINKLRKKIERNYGRSYLRENQQNCNIPIRYRYSSKLMQYHQFRRVQASLRNFFFIGNDNLRRISQKVHYVTYCIWDLFLRQ